MTLTNRTRAWGFIQSEANPFRSRDRVTLDGSSAHLLGASLVAGTVLGQITASGKFVPSPKTGSDGSQVACAILGEDTDVLGGDMVVAVLARDAEVRAEDLTYDASVALLADQQAKWAQLKGSGGATGFGRLFVRVQGGVQVGAPHTTVP